MSTPVRIPADVDMADKVIGPLSARQLAILAITGLVLYALWTLTRGFVPLPVFLTLAIPVAAAAAVLALGKRDGVSADRLLLAAIRQRLHPRHRVAAPEGTHRSPSWLSAHATTTEESESLPQTDAPAPLQLPATSISEAGVIDLAEDGLAVVAAASTVNFALRTPAEQEALVAGFGRYLHSLTSGVQILVRAERVDLSGPIAELREHASALPHPALEGAAREHADYLAQLGDETDLLRRQVLLVLRENTATTPPAGDTSMRQRLAAVLGGGPRRRHTTTPEARHTAEARLVRKLDEAAELLAPAGIVLTPLDAADATATLAAACNPDTLLNPGSDLAGADEVITTVPADEESPQHARPHPAQPDAADETWQDFYGAVDDSDHDDIDEHDERERRHR